MRASRKRLFGSRGGSRVDGLQPKSLLPKTSNLLDPKHAGKSTQCKGMELQRPTQQAGGINLMSTRFFQRSKTLRVLLVLLACRTLLCSPCSYTNTIKLSPPRNRFLNPPLFMSIENFHIVEDDATACQQVLQIFPQYLMFKPQIYVEPI